MALRPKTDYPVIPQGKSRVSGITLDAGGLIALDRNDRRMLALIARATERGMRITIPATLLPHAMWNPLRQAPLSRLARQPGTDLVPLNGPMQPRSGCFLPEPAPAISRTPTWSSAPSRWFLQMPQPKGRTVRGDQRACRFNPARSRYQLHSGLIGSTAAAPVWHSLRRERSERFAAPVLASLHISLARQDPRFRMQRPGSPAQRHLDAMPLPRLAGRHVVVHLVALTHLPDHRPDVVG